MWKVLLFGLAGGVIAAGAFVAGIVVDRLFLSSCIPALGLDPQVPAADTGDPRLRKREAVFKQYLSRKTITLKDPGSPADKEAATHTIAAGEVEAVQFANGASSINGGAWQTTVTFIVNTGPARHAVHGSVRYREVGDTPVFVVFDATEVSRQ